MTNSPLKQMPVGASPKYVVITPARDESAYIEETIKSMISQSVVPCEWIIVDDGSTDATPDIVARYSQQHGWIKLVGNPVDRKLRDIAGGAPTKAFNFGLKHLSTDDYEFLVKLDADIAFGSEYFETMLAKFSANSKLGIASGVLIEKRKGYWRKRPLLHFQKGEGFHAAGASKIYRKKCFEDIGGIAPVKGWDTVDEIRAQLKGWETSCVSDCRFYHLRGEGTRSGLLKTSLMHGEISYAAGGSVIFCLVKSTYRMVRGKPFILSGIWMLVGYMKCLLKRSPRIVTEEERIYYRNQQMNRIWTFLRAREDINPNHSGRHT